MLSVVLVIGALDNVDAEVIQQGLARGGKIRAVENLIELKPILFKQYVIDYKDNWL